MNTSTTSIFQPSVTRSSSAFVRSIIASFRTTWAARKERARLHTELSHYTDRELADMNLSRADISHVVRSWLPS